MNVTNGKLLMTASSVPPVGTSPVALSAASVTVAVSAMMISLPPASSIVTRMLYLPTEAVSSAYVWLSVTVKLHVPGAEATVPVLAEPSPQSIVAV